METEKQETPEPHPIDTANLILRAVEWGTRSHASGLWLIEKAQRRAQAQSLRDQVKVNA